jgi:hypothetical protein
LCGGAHGNEPTPDETRDGAISLLIATRSD